MEISKTLQKTSIRRHFTFFALQDDSKIFQFRSAWVLRQFAQNKLFAIAFAFNFVFFWCSWTVKIISIVRSSLILNLLLWQKPMFDCRIDGWNALHDNYRIYWFDIFLDFISPKSSSLIKMLNLFFVLSFNLFVTSSYATETLEFFPPILYFEERNPDESHIIRT